MAPPPVLTAYGSRRREEEASHRTGRSVMTPEETQYKEKRSTYYASWVVERTGGIARYVHGPMGRPVIFYKGPCQDCGCEFVTERQPHRSKVQGNGRWPEHCAECWKVKDAAHNAAAKERMRRLREAQRDRKEHNDRLLGRTWGGRRKGAGRKPKNNQDVPYM